jgi:hypothetical protein
VIHHAHVFSELGWGNFVEEVPATVNRHKPFGNFSAMTPDVVRGFIERAGLHCETIRTDVVPRDAIAVMRAPSS